MALPEFPEHRRSSAVATWAAAGPLSAAIAPSAAAAILEVSSWRVVYFVTAPVALVVLALSLRLVARSRADDAEGRLDLAGTVLATLAIGLLILAISQGSAWGWGTPADHRRPPPRSCSAWCSWSAPAATRPPCSTCRCSGCPRWRRPTWPT